MSSSSRFRQKSCLSAALNSCSIICNLPLFFSRSMTRPPRSIWPTAKITYYCESTYQYDRGATGSSCSGSNVSCSGRAGHCTPRATADHYKGACRTKASFFFFFFFAVFFFFVVRKDTYLGILSLISSRRRKTEGTMAEKTWWHEERNQELSEEQVLALRSQASEPTEQLR